MIRRITKLKDFGIFRDGKYDAASGVPEFKKRNLIYGWNYSGKTTLSRLFHNLETQSKAHHAESSFSVELDNGTHLSNELLTNSLTVRVFNRDYVAENFREEHTAPAVFIVGERSIELDQRLAVLRARLMRLNGLEERYGGQKDAVRKSLDEGATHAASSARSVLQDSAFERPRLRDRIKEIASDTQSYVLSDEELRTRIATLTSEDDYAQLPQPSLRLPDLAALSEATSEVLRKTASSVVLEEFREKTQFAAWAHQGLELHKGQRICAFCKGELTEERLKELQGHFSEAYNDLLSEVKARLRQVAEAASVLDIEKALPDEFRLLPEQRKLYADLRAKLLVWANWVREALETLREQLEMKQTAIETSLEFESSLGRKEEGEAVLLKLFSAITQHNDAVGNLESVKDDARRAIELHFAARHYVDAGVEAKEKEEQRFKDRTSRASQAAQKVQAAIREVETRVDQAAIGAERLNELLSLLLSQSDIEARAIGKSQFQFLRGGEPAVDLSEGERTAVTLAYFLTSLEAGGNRLEETIVFIDDPMCSLDSNHLYTVYGLLVETLEKCRQAFVSTHSCEFFNLLKSAWKGLASTSMYYVQRSLNQEGLPIGVLKELPTLLKKYSSEYQFIFSLLFDFAQNSDPTQHEKYTAPNLLRKFLESYLGFRKPDVPEWHKKLDLLFGSQQEKARAVHKLADDASHLQRLERSMQEPAFPIAVKECVQDVLDALQEKDPCHYDSLVRVVTGGTP